MQVTKRMLVLEAQSIAQKLQTSATWEATKARYEYEPRFYLDCLTGVHGPEAADVVESIIIAGATSYRRGVVTNPRYATDAERASRAEEAGRLREIAEEAGREAVSHLLTHASRLQDVGSWTRNRYHLPEDSAYLQCKALLALPKDEQTRIKGNARGKQRKLWDRAKEVVERFASRIQRFDRLHKPRRATVGVYSSYQSIPTGKRGESDEESARRQAMLDSLNILHVESTVSVTSHILGYGRYLSRLYARRLYSHYTLGRGGEDTCPDCEVLHTLTSWATQDHTLLDSEATIMCANQFLRTNTPRMSPQGRRALLLLLTGEGFTYREIGASIGMSEGAVKVLAYRYLAALREHVGAVMLDSIAGSAPSDRYILAR